MQFFNLSLVTFLFFNPLLSEIQKVEIKWQNANCSLACAQNIGQQLRAVAGVAEAQINLAGGQANLRLIPNYPFSLRLINVALGRMNVTADSIRVKVRGILQFTGNSYYLISIGDNTIFNLLGPIDHQAGQTTNYNKLTTPLNPYLQSHLLDGIKNNRVTLVEGHIINPHGLPPLSLIIEQLTFVILE